MGVLGVLPKPSASTGVTKAQGKSSGCQQRISVGPVGAWDRRCLQSSPWQLGVLSVLLEATLQRCAIQHLEKHLLSHPVSARRHHQWLSQDADVPGHHPQPCASPVPHRKRHWGSTKESKAVDSTYSRPWGGCWSGVSFLGISWSSACWPRARSDVKCSCSPVTLRLWEQQLQQFVLLWWWSSALSTRTSSQEGNSHKQFECGFTPFHELHTATNFLWASLASLPCYHWSGLKTTWASTLFSRMCFQWNTCFCFRTALNANVFVFISSEQNVCNFTGFVLFWTCYLQMD